MLVAAGADVGGNGLGEKECPAGGSAGPGGNGRFPDAGGAGRGGRLAGAVGVEGDVYPQIRFVGNSGHFVAGDAEDRRVFRARFDADTEPFGAGGCLCPLGFILFEWLEVSVRAEIGFDGPAVLRLGRQGRAGDAVEIPAGGAGF